MSFVNDFDTKNLFFLFFSAYCKKQVTSCKLQLETGVKKWRKKNGC